MRKVKIGGKYRHFKGIMVNVITIAKDSEDLSKLVIYEHDGEVWARKMTEFLSEVDHQKYPDVKQKYRFEEIEDEK